jgi:hypothetical protein
MRYPYHLGIYHLIRLTDRSIGSVPVISGLPSDQEWVMIDPIVEQSNKDKTMKQSNNNAKTRRKCYHARLPEMMPPGSLPAVDLAKEELAPPERKFPSA